MSDYISRQKLRDAIQRNLDMQDLYLPIEFLELIDDAPAADVRPVKEGHWIPVTNGRGGHECDQCHNYAPSFQTGDERLSDFCCCCGAKMGGPS